MTPIDLEAFFYYYRRLPHQMAAVQALANAMPPRLLQQDAEWVQTYRAAGKQPDKKPPTNPVEAPYFTQRDSRTEHAWWQA